MSARFSLLAASCALVSALDPNFAVNITVFHINELKYGPKPINMDTGDAAGDMFFDFHNGYIYPLQCPHGAASGGSCSNPEVVAPNLMVNKVILEVDRRYSDYARCNVGINGSASGVPCEDDTYCCACNAQGGSGHGAVVPCNATLGAENILESHGGRSCGSGSQPYECFKDNAAKKFTEDVPGYWYSSLRESYCGEGADYYSSDCTWRVVSVPKVVTKECHADTFLGVVEQENQGCFSACGAARNTSSVCWTQCFYETVLGPNSGKAGGAVAGMDLQKLLSGWTAPFDSEDAAVGGCPNVGKVTIVV